MRTPSPPLRAVIAQLGFLTSADYVTELLRTRHGVTTAAAVARARTVVPHARTALAYLDQVYAGPLEVSFLPGYYAILNLIKVTILLSSRHADLRTNRWHGAVYRTYDKASRSLLTEQIHLKRGGALPLFYEVITGQSWGREKTIAMRDIYPYLADASSEWTIASGSQARLATLSCSVTSGVGRELVIRVAPRPGHSAPRRSELRALRGVRQDPGNPSEFRRTIPALTETPAEMVQKAISPTLIYHPYEGVTVVALNARRMLMFEEWPIALAFFHMSSVVRYQPEFLARLRDSRYWPVVAALHDVLFRYLMLTWSYATQATVTFEPG